MRSTGVREGIGGGVLGATGQGSLTYFQASTGAVVRSAEQTVSVCVCAAEQRPSPRRSPCHESCVGGGTNGSKLGVRNGIEMSRL